MADARPTATLKRAQPWLVELTGNLDGLASAYGRRPAIDPRLREWLFVATAHALGADGVADLHQSWSEFLGPGGRAADEDSLVEYVATSSLGPPGNATELAELFEPEQVGAVRAIVAASVIASLGANSTTSLLKRLTGRRAVRPLPMALEAAVTSWRLPGAVAGQVLGAAMRGAARAVPPLPPIDVPPVGESNLLTHVLATTLPELLGHTGARAAIAMLPIPLVVGVRSGRSGSTMRLSSGRLAVANGLASDVAVVVEASGDLLVAPATGAMVREVGSLRVRRR